MNNKEELIIENKKLQKCVDQLEKENRQLREDKINFVKKLIRKLQEEQNKMQIKMQEEIETKIRKELLKGDYECIEI